MYSGKMTAVYFKQLVVLSMKLCAMLDGSLSYGTRELWWRDWTTQSDWVI